MGCLRSLPGGCPTCTACRREIESRGYRRGVEAAANGLLDKARDVEGRAANQTDDETREWLKGGAYWLRKGAAALLPPEAAPGGDACKQCTGEYAGVWKKDGNDAVCGQCGARYPKESLTGKPAPSPSGREAPVVAKDCVHGLWNCRRCDWYWGLPREYIEDGKRRL